MKIKINENCCTYIEAYYACRLKLKHLNMKILRTMTNNMNMTIMTSIMTEINIWMTL